MLTIDLSEPNRKASITISNNIQTEYSIFDERGPDPDWRYKDDAGHWHAWNLISKEVTSLTRVIDEVIEHPGCECYGTGDCYDCDDDDNCEAWTETKSHLACKLCGEPIEPGTKVIHQAGHPHYYQNGYREITANFQISYDEEPMLFDQDGRASLIEVRYGDSVLKGYVTQVGYSNGIRRARFISFREA